MEQFNGRPIHPLEARLVIESDASKRGWGAHCRNTQERTQMHINYLELQAAFLALQSFAKNCINIHNVVAISYINQMGGTRFSQSLQPSTGIVRLVHRQGDLSACRTPPRQDECNSGLRVKIPNESRHLTDSSD